MSLDNIMDKYVFLFGATGGVGELLAKELNRQGFKIIGIGRKEDILKKMKKEKIIEDYIIADVTKEEDINKVIEKIREYSNKFGKDNVYVFYNQGILHKKSDPKEYSYEDIQTSFNVNVKSIMYLDGQIYQYVGGIGYMISISAYYRGDWDRAYQVTKAALKAWVESVCCMNNYPTIFAVSPDTIYTGEKGMGTLLRGFPQIPAEILIPDIAREFKEFVNRRNKYTEFIYEIDSNSNVNKYILTEKDSNETGRIPYERKRFLGTVGKAIYVE